MSEPNDLSAFWLPFTDNRRFKAHPRMFVSAKDMHYTSASGHKVLDATGGNYTVIFMACTVTYFLAVIAIHLLSPRLARVEI